MTAHRLPYPAPFMDLPTLAEHICTGESTIENWVKLGLFPPPKKVGGKRLWQWSKVERHLADESQPVQSSLAESITNAVRRAATEGR
jgi:predicted DNA-binding transcriptional regulator AlpA